MCDVKRESYDQLRNHERAFHMQSKSSETEEKEMEDKEIQSEQIEVGKRDIETIESENEENFGNYAKYLCFYCEQEITSEQHMLEHNITCHGANDTPSLFSLPVRPKPILFQCAICGLVKSSEAEIVNHKKSIHASQ